MAVSAHVRGDKRPLFKPMTAVHFRHAEHTMQLQNLYVMFNDLFEEEKKSWFLGCIITC